MLTLISTKEFAMADTKDVICTGFNYCRVSKIIVSIALFPIIALIAFSWFDDLYAQLFAAIAAIGITVYAAIWIDQLPWLQKKIPSLVRCEKK